MLFTPHMASFARYIMILITTLAFVTSNVALGAVHAANPSHLGSTVKDATDHQHHTDQKIAAADSLDADASSSSKHHSDNSASGCCAFACGGAVVSSHTPDFLPSAVLSRMPILVSDSIRATKQSPHDRPPRSIEYLAG